MIKKLCMLLVAAPLFSLSAAWTPFVNVSGAGDSSNVGGPVLDLNVLNNGVSVWVTPGFVGDVQSSFYTFGSGWSAPVTISDTSLNPFGNPRYVGQGDPTVAINSSNYAVTAWEGSVFLDEPQTNVEGIFAVFRTPNGVWSPVQAVSTLDPNDSSLNPENPFIDVSDTGLAVCVWTELRSSGRYIMANFLPFAGTWGTPIELANPFNGFREDTPMVQINNSNHAVAVWKTESPLFQEEIGASTYNSSTGLWTTVTLDPGATDTSLPRVGIDDSGNAVAVWVRENGLFPDIDYEIVSSSFNFATQTWGPMTVIAIGSLAVDPISMGSGYVVVDPFGTATAAWTQRLNGIDVVYASRLPLGGSWSTPEVISDPTIDTFVDAEGFTQITMGVDRQGNVIVFTVNSDSVLQSISRLFTLGWQPPQTIATIFNTLYREIRLGTCGFALAQWNNAPEETAQASANLDAFPLASPTNFLVTGCCQKFATQKRCFNFLSWDSSSACVQQFLIFRDGLLIAAVPGDQNTFTDVLCKSRLSTFLYSIIAVNALGVQSEAVVALVRP